MEFDVAAFVDLAWWVEKDLTQALKSQRESFAGLGKPEPLRHELKGCWSRRIDRERRIGYQVRKRALPAIIPVADYTLQVTLYSIDG